MVDKNTNIEKLDRSVKGVGMVVSSNPLADKSTNN